MFDIRRIHMPMAQRLLVPGGLLVLVTALLLVSCSPGNRRVRSRRAAPLPAPTAATESPAQIVERSAARSAEPRATSSTAPRARPRLAGGWNEVLRGGDSTRPRRGRPQAASTASPPVTDEAVDGGFEEATRSGEASAADARAGDEIRLDVDVSMDETTVDEAGETIESVADEELVEPDAELEGVTSKTIGDGSGAVGNETSMEEAAGDSEDSDADVDLDLDLDLEGLETGDGGVGEAGEEVEADTEAGADVNAGTEAGADLDLDLDLDLGELEGLDIDSSADSGAEVDPAPGGGASEKQESDADLDLELDLDLEGLEGDAMGAEPRESADASSIETPAAGNERASPVSGALDILRRATGENGSRRASQPQRAADSSAGQETAEATGPAADGDAELDVDKEVELEDSVPPPVEPEVEIPEEIEPGDLEGGVRIVDGEAGGSTTDGAGREATDTDAPQGGLDDSRASEILEKLRERRRQNLDRAADVLTEARQLLDQQEYEAAREKALEVYELDPGMAPTVEKLLNEILRRSHEADGGN